MTCRPSRVLPIIIDGHLMGAVGISGVKAFEDEKIAMHAINTVFPQETITRAGEENDGF